MGFFKKIFSLSTSRRKKDKRKQSTALARQLTTDAEGRLVRSEDQPHDSDATRLLRSASARWASTDAIQTLAPRMCYILVVVFLLNSLICQLLYLTSPCQHLQPSPFKPSQAV